MDVAIIDYKISNMFSVQSACQHVGLKAITTSDREEILKAKAAILPGVGTFGAAMDQIHQLGLDEVILEYVSSRRPFLGICLGMQLLLTDSQEFGLHQGLNLIPGQVRRLNADGGGIHKAKVPHIGWAEVKQTLSKPCSWSCHPMEGVNPGASMYFVHSYAVFPDDEQHVLTTTPHGKEVFCSTLVKDNVVACQFHPEKSGLEGIKIFKNLAASIKG